MTREGTVTHIVGATGVVAGTRTKLTELDSVKPWVRVEFGRQLTALAPTQYSCHVDLLYLPAALINGPINRSINQSINQSINRSINRSINQLKSGTFL